MRTKWHVAPLFLLPCALFFLVGCGLDRDPIVLGPGVVTPGSGSTDHPSPTDNAASPTAIDSTDSPAACGPSGDTQKSTNGAPASAVPAPFRDDDAQLDADGQTGDGHVVIIDEVQLARADGFVAVCTLDDNRLLGSSPITRSTDEQSILVTLDEPITTTTRLLVVLHADNGDGHFDWATDPRVSGDDDDITDLEVERLTYRYAG
jgi:hypothetical protein